MVNPRVIVLASLILLGSHVAAADRIKVAIVPGIAVNVDAARVDALGQDLADALAGELDVDAVGGLEVRRELPTTELQPDCVTTPACVTEVAKRLGANQLLFLVVVDSGASGSIQVDATWVDAVTDRAVSRPAIDLVATDAPRAKFAADAHLLLPDAPVRPKPQPTKMTNAVPRHFALPAKLTLAVGVVGLGVAIGFAIPTRSHYDSCDADPNHCTAGQRSTIRYLALGADAGLLVALGGAIATGVLFATSDEKAHLVIEPTPGGVGAAVLGRF